MEDTAKAAVAVVEIVRAKEPEKTEFIYAVARPGREVGRLIVSMSWKSRPVENALALAMIASFLAYCGWVMTKMVFKMAINGG